MSLRWKHLLLPCEELSDLKEKIAAYKSAVRP